MSGDRIDLLAEIHRLEEENKELRRVNKVKQELYQEQKERADMLDKELDNACELLSQNATDSDGYSYEKETWKEKCLKNA